MTSRSEMNFFMTFNCKVRVVNLSHLQHDRGHVFAISLSYSKAELRVPLNRNVWLFY